MSMNPRSLANGAPGMRKILPLVWPVLLFILSLCGFAGALATRLLDPLITSIASE
jgi:hypothetical protein